ncbi:hypothetical protein L6452_31267 [Arctium lappa]|uniref:Uncharacterized protein n=1 Tax=Arctium lappa TaxID=4217 RepID=A0ACB8ZPU7_ARCLA|nr:hypothetical protein L6452_31267 [Arctium lappa]
MFTSILQNFSFSGLYAVCGVITLKRRGVRFGWEWRIPFSVFRFPSLCEHFHPFYAEFSHAWCLTSKSY